MLFGCNFSPVLFYLDFFFKNAMSTKLFVFKDAMPHVTL